MRKSLKTLCAALGMAAVVTASAPSAHALVSSFDVLNFKPAISNRTDYFTIYSSQTVAKHGWNAGFYVDFAHNPLEVAFPVLGRRFAGVVDNTITGNFYATYGLLDWFSVGMNIPVVFWLDYVNTLGPPFGTGTGTSDSMTELGDIRMELKFRILNNEDKLIGLALVPFFTIPSGDSTHFVGNGTVTGGIKIALDFNIHERVKLALNVGFLARDDVTIGGVRIDDQLLLGLGLSIKIIERLSFLVEAHTEPVVRDLFENEVQTPAEVLGGFRIKVAEHWDINVGGGAGLTLGVGSPDFRAFLGLNYNWAPEPCPACDRPAQVEARQITIDQVIHFEFDKANIRPQSYPILDDVVAIIKSNPSIKMVKIEGYTDSIGSDAYNMKLSQRRANSVKTYLVNKGIPASMLDAVGFGESKPVATNDTAEGRAKNRRTEFHVEQ
ncbi:OmpA family protein [bacterium]|nr:MAG: OmpA family protein [bacterium]